MKLLFPILIFAICSVSLAQETPANSNGLLFINTIEAGPENGCTTNLGKSGKLSCGHAPWISEVKWKFIGTSSKGDEYEFTRTYPKDSSDKSVDTKKVFFKSDEVVIWKDSKQRIILKKASTEQGAAANP